ncbi:unnamed protein product [Caenorhabditis angaria]|uniref:Uncharacterized protein n=1 Tax=Caenorhabditis angaria TaxID=860376 RepID=A0A9P1I8A9_9PELO|nr:unnamed protein product [Caenorhabditis angaria]
MTEDAIRFDQLLPILILFLILCLFLYACVRECCDGGYSEQQTQKVQHDLGPLPKITVTNGKTGEERVIQE